MKIGWVHEKKIISEGRVGSKGGLAGLHGNDASRTSGTVGYTVFSDATQRAIRREPSSALPFAFSSGRSRAAREHGVSSSGAQPIGAIRDHLSENPTPLPTTRYTHTLNQ